MDPAGVDVFSLAEKRLAWVDAPQMLLAQNIANVDTPGWRARDLKPFDAALSSARVVSARTNPMHLAGGDSAGPPTEVSKSERAPDGNAVSLDKELAKVADTETTHQLVTQLYLKYQSLFRLALGH